ncbi:hypothetical protein [Deinococcus humi]|uniref:Uncharacterized protein n=1 Tax=Deinococcus humi TaxID=662880 RepID=A0A7W8NEI2_9DEIO|nr:hypothetical protein [Deinococcus humi]MBB5361813.1 hypothetical protein [Deinococcus humi]GGO23544.1 hypothetical protein GCM10008949_11820 [Deinococcus humi]
MKKLALISLPLLLAACGGPGAPGTSSATVSASTLNVNLSSVSDTGSTTYTFTNRAGAHETIINTATLTWTDEATKTEKSATVNIPSLTLPAGLTCPAATTPTAACNFNDPATTYADRTLTRTIDNGELFRKVLADNPSVTNLPVDVKFGNTANTLGFSFTSTASTTGGGTGGPGTPTTPVAKPPAPVLTINTLGSGPFSGTLSVTVSGNFDAVSTVDKVILEVTDPSGNINNTSYVSTSASATFSLDTSKYKDGNLKLKVIALSKEGLRGETSSQTVQISNISAPAFEILSPSAGAIITGPTTVRVQVREGNTPFTLQTLSGNDNVRLDVRDFRGQIIKTDYGTVQQTSPGVLEAFIPLDLIGPNFSSNSYALEISAVAQLSNGANITLSAGTQISTQVNDNKPPALQVLMPAYINDPYTNQNVRGILSRFSALMVQASDDNSVSSLRIDFTCDEATKTSTQVCPRAPYSFNFPVRLAGIIQRVFDIGALMDAQPYVQNGNYTLRVTAFDGQNANIQEFPVRVSRDAVDSTIPGLGTMVETTTVPDLTSGALNPSSATWAIPGAPTHPYRLAVLAYDGAANQAVEIPTRTSLSPEVPAGTPITRTQGFSDVGIYRIDYIVEDLTTGVTRYYQGGAVAVKKNP